MGRSCRKRKNEAGMQYVWKFTVARTVSCTFCRVPCSSVPLQLEELGTKWPRYDSIISSDNRRIAPVEIMPRRCHDNSGYLVKRAYLETDGSKARVQRVEWVEPRKMSAGQERKYSVDAKAQEHCRLLGSQWSMDATEAGADAPCGQ